MKIAVDARELAGRPTGVGRYLAELLACWTRDPAASRHEITLFATEPVELPGGLIGEGGARAGTQVIPAARSGLAHLWWEQRPLPAAAARSGADVLFCPGYSGPVVSRVPVVVTIHDVSFWAHPEWFNGREGPRRRLTSWLAAHRSRLILTVSEFSRDEIIRWLDAAPARVRAIHQGVGGFFDPGREQPLSIPLHPAAPSSPGTSGGKEVGPALQAGADASVKTTAPPLPPEKPGGTGVWGYENSALVLTVGSIFNRRHVDTLIRAFARIASIVPHARLVVVGENRTHPYQDLEALIQQLGIPGRVELRSYVTDAELLALYSQARAFAFLSTYEGFGLTPLEAIAAGVPAVVYDTEVARETLGGLARFTPAGDLDALADTLRVMLTASRADSPDHAAHAREARARFPWTRTAALTLAALEEAARA